MELRKCWLVYFILSNKRCCISGSDGTQKHKSVAANSEFA